MTKVNADTPAASAVASAVASDDLESGFLPEDPEYRKTGKLPEKDDDEENAATKENEEQETEQENADTEAASAAATEEEDDENADTAAASAAASTQENKGTRKSPATSENRWQKLSKENQKLREELARQQGREEARSTSQQTRETEQRSQAAPENKKPAIDDVDQKTGKPKYSTYADYENARDEWNRKEAIREFNESNTKTQRDQQLQQAEATIQQEMNKRASKARKDYADYDELSDAAIAAKDDQGREVIYFPKGSAIDQFFLHSERSHDVFYQIFKDLAKHSHIFARNQQGQYNLNPFQQVRALMQIEAALPDPGKTPVKKVTQASRPPNQVDGKNAVTKSARDQALEDGDSSTYINDANASDPRLAAVRASRKKG